MTGARPFHGWFERWGPWLFGALALAPFCWCHASFKDLFWFGDDWDQLDLIARMGFWRWTLQPFAENFAPLFKLAWGSLALAGGGSYFPLLAALWLTHALNVALLVKWLRQAGFGWLATSLSAAGFGLASANLETLGWSVQWSAILATTFFLGAATMEARADAEGAGGWRTLGGLAALAAASALSFSRGVLTGLALALLGLIPRRGPSRPLSRRLRLAAACLLPTLAVGTVIFICASGNHQHLGKSGVLSSVSQFGLWYFSLAPFYRLLSVDSWGWHTTLLLGALKAALVIWALRRSTGRMRRLLALLGLLNLGDAALLGLGRYHTGLEATISSRYHYNALLCTLPFVGFWVETQLARLVRPGMFLRPFLAAALAAAAGLWVARDWPEQARIFADSRGRNTRSLLFQTPNPPPAGAIPGIPFLSTARAKELVRLYHLH